MEVPPFYLTILAIVHAVFSIAPYGPLVLHSLFLDQ